jgi:hypothetical protein
VSESHSDKKVRFEDPSSDPDREPSAGADDLPRYNNADAVVSSDIGGTLEEEVIANMAPIKRTVGGPSTDTYVPVLDTTIASSELPRT